MIRKLAKRGSPTMTVEIKDGKLINKLETGFNTKLTELPLDGTAIEEDNYGGGKSKVVISNLFLHTLCLAKELQRGLV